MVRNYNIKYPNQFRPALRTKTDLGNLSHLYIYIRSLSSELGANSEPLSNHCSTFLFFLKCNDNTIIMSWYGDRAIVQVVPCMPLQLQTVENI